MRSSPYKVGMMGVAVSFAVSLIFIIIQGYYQESKTGIQAADNITIDFIDAYPVTWERLTYDPNPDLQNKSMIDLLADMLISMTNDLEERGFIQEQKKEGKSNPEILNALKNKLYQKFGGMYIPRFHSSDAPNGINELLLPPLSQEELKEENLKNRIREYLRQRGRFRNLIIYNYDKIILSLLAPISTLDYRFYASAHIMLTGQPIPITNSTSITYPDQYNRCNINPLTYFPIKGVQSSMGTVVHVKRDESVDGRREGMCLVFFVAPTQQVSSIGSNRPFISLLGVPGFGLLERGIEGLSKDALNRLEGIFGKIQSGVIIPPPPSTPPIVPPNAPSNQTTPEQAPIVIPPSEQFLPEEGSASPPMGIRVPMLQKKIGNVFAFFQSPAPDPNPKEVSSVVGILYISFGQGDPYGVAVHQFQFCKDRSGNFFPCLDKDTPHHQRILRGGRIIIQSNPGVMIDSGMTMMIERVKCLDSPHAMPLSKKTPRIGDGVRVAFNYAPTGGQDFFEASIINSISSYPEQTQYYLDLDSIVRKLGIEGLSIEEQKTTLLNRKPGGQFPSGILPGSPVISKELPPEIIGFISHFHVVDGKIVAVMRQADLVQNSFIYQPSPNINEQFISFEDYYEKFNMNRVRTPQ